MSHLDFPYTFDGRGRTAHTDRAGYLRHLIEQVLLTTAGERVMRPDFGSGVRELVFGAASPEVAATTQFLVQGALQQWLGDLIAVEAVEVEARDSALVIEVHFMDRQTQARSQARFTARGGAP